MNKSHTIKVTHFLAWLSLLLFVACSTQKDNAANRRLQNLSARYNYIYNANVLLSSYEENLAQANLDNYDQILNVYIAPPQIDYLSEQNSAAENKELSSISKKAQSIITEKNFSNYIDEAYMLLGKTNFYTGNYYNAAEYFDYVERAYKKDKKVYLNALNWKARTYMQLQNQKMANRSLDSILVTLDSVKSGKSAPYATLAQMSITEKNYPQAISYLEKAIKSSHTMESRTRWPYILGQLYEIQQNFPLSLKNYSKVEHSNAPFEMYFNARLSKIRIIDQMNNGKSDRNALLLKLIKDEKNLDFTDQIYFEVAEDFFADSNWREAEKYYKLSAQNSTKNLNQKGISFLKLADLNFSTKNDYLNAKLYYDSALNSLPKNYPSYSSILKKAQNLEYLSERIELIKDQDTLQFIASLPLSERNAKVAALLRSKLTTKPEEATNGEKSVGNVIVSNSDNTFYFNNSNALSKGQAAFKKRWGTRILEINWRQSVKSSAQATQQTQLNLNAGNQGVNTAGRDALADDQLALQVQAYLSKLPLSNEQINQSNQKILNAYLEIGSFYQQVLEDQQEAAKTYEKILSQFPKNNALETVYYSLYLAYKTSDPSKSERYKSLILKNYPNSNYAKTILDPAFSLKQSALELAVNKLYNEVFSKYEEKDYNTVIKNVNEANQRFPGNSLQIQFDYLKAISIGKTQELDSLMLAFEKINRQYPQDSLVLPLIKDHINYINSNLNIFKEREIALLDFDEKEQKFIAQKQAPQLATNVAQSSPLTPPVIAGNSTAQATNPASTPVNPPAAPPKATTVDPPKNVQSTPGIQTDGLFSTAESKTYYFVVNVSSTEISVSSSRFGIGQFNRSNYGGSNLKHQLANLSEDQPIFVGNFDDLNQVKAYSEEIKSQLPKIMKVPANLYTTFYITKENFDKIKDRSSLNRYLEFFKNYYEKP